MLPTLFKIGPLVIHSYGLMIAIGFLVALYFIRRDAQKANLDVNAITDMAFWGLIAGIIGTRILYIIMFPQDFSWSDPIGWIAIWNGGLVFQGGPPASIAFCYFYLKRRGMPVGTVTDIVLPYLPLGHAFGRIGCFLNGCCYGRPTSMPWGIPFRRVPWDVTQEPTGSPAYLDHLRQFPDVTLTSHWSHPVHPTQLYESAALVVICLILLKLRKSWHPFFGFTLPVYLILYSIWRFFNEFFRGDHNPVHVGILSDQQVFCLIFAAVGVALFAVMAAVQRPRHTKRPS